MGYRYRRGVGGKVLIAMLLLFISFCIFSIVLLTLSLFVNVDDGKIGINVTSGKVRVDIVDTNQESIIGDVIDFVTADVREDVFFEPGSTYMTEGFRVKNIGTCPINYRMHISNDKDVDMDKFKEAFEFWITSDPENYEDVEKITSFKGTLEIDQTSDTFYLIIKMKESAGNEFQDKSYSGIGITVYAVQSDIDFKEW